MNSPLFCDIIAAYCTEIASQYQVTISTFLRVRALAIWYVNNTLENYTFFVKIFANWISKIANFMRVIFENWSQNKKKKFHRSRDRQTERQRKRKKERVILVKFSLTSIMCTLFLLGSWASNQIFKKGAGGLTGS